MAHANDGGGSIRIPASNCGLVGLKPTRQRISEGPLIGDNLSGLTAELVVSRSVRDTARMLDAVQGAAPGDPYVAPAPLRPYVDELDRRERRPADRDHDRPPRSRASRSSPTASRRSRSAAKLLESLGHEVDDGSPLDVLPDGRGRHRHRGQLPDPLGGRPGRDPDPDRDAPRPRVDRRRRRAADLGRWREIGHERDGGRYLLDVGVHQALSPDDRRLVRGRLRPAADPDDGRGRAEARQLRHSRRRPDGRLPPRLPSGAFTALFNVTGQPAISLPLHWTDEGVPVGVQLVAPFGREDLLIRIAAQLERAAAVGGPDAARVRRLAPANLSA